MGMMLQSYIEGPLAFILLALLSLFFLCFLSLITSSSMAKTKTKGGEMRGDYMIIRPEKIGFLNVLSLLLLRRRISSYKFIETNEENELRADWITSLVLAILKVLSTIEQPLRIIGLVTEFILNLLALNGGILGLIKNFITASLVIPKRGTVNFRSILGFIDSRLDLYKSNPLIDDFSIMNSEVKLGDLNPLDLSMMASKVAYENAAFVENAVTNHWKMNFVGFYNCWNKFLQDFATQAFIFTDKAEDANLIVLAFRGTEPFNAKDWSTDVDLSWILTGKMGKLHLGFLKALGLQDEKDFVKGFPKDFHYPADKPVAYYVIREVLKSLLSKHKNAKILLTGHSLGAALSVLFPVILSYHGEENILNALYGVMNYGQPRVGDATFVTYMKMLRIKYHRMVYRYDIVPRVPFDFPPFALFKHGGKCMYYKGWYQRQEVDDSPNPNYFDLKYQPSMYLNAWGDLIKALFIGWTAGKEYRESWVSILYRATGLIIPGIASHSPRDYVNAGRLAKINTKDHGLGQTSH